jgi:hypothetical protein
MWCSFITLYPIPSSLHSYATGIHLDYPSLPPFSLTLIVTNGPQHHHPWGCRSKRALLSKRPEHAQDLWNAQHEEASGRIFDILCDLRGFYLKLGQILATKTEMLPEPYTNSLRRLLDKMPPVHFKKVSQHGLSFFGCGMILKEYP